MQSKTVQCFKPEDLKAEIDFIISADDPTFISITEMICARGSFIICWIPA